MSIEITRKIEFDAGHRIPTHASKCKNAHGHRYVLEATVSGDIVQNPGATDDGMIQDFGDLKAILMEAVGEPWDHAFLVYKYDLPMQAALGCLGYDHKTVVLDVIPTVENMVELAAFKIQNRLQHAFELVRLRLYETPNCWADWVKL